MQSSESRASLNRLVIIRFSALFAALVMCFGSLLSKHTVNSKALILWAWFLLPLLMLDCYFSFYRSKNAKLSDFISALLAGCLTFISGGETSVFVPLLLPFVMVSVVRDRNSSYLHSTMMFGVVYTLCVLARMYTFISPIDPLSAQYANLFSLSMHLIGVWSSLILVSISTAFLVKVTENHKQKILEAENKFNQERERQQNLINDLPDGIIITDNSGIIQLTNDSLLSLLNLNREDILLRDIKETLGHKFSNLPGISEQKSGKPLHLISNQPLGVDLSCSIRSIKDSNGDHSGWMYIVKDVTRIRSIEEQLSLQEQMVRLSSQEKDVFRTHTKMSDFVGESAVMHRVFDLISRVAPSDATTLIVGESGTGKELVARAIHLGSPRSNEKFVTINCGAIPENLLEAELFGSKKGSYTGAHADRPGLFVEAINGTLFLDEIGELPLALQVKLLRVLQERTVRPIGGTTDIPVDVRIVAATNRNLKKEIEFGRFREDLFYRINVISIQVPSLRERIEDIPCLAHSLLSTLSPNKKVTMSAQAMQYLVKYSYPGNVRELENILERAIVLGGDVILPEHLPDHVINPVSGDSGRTTETTILELSDVSLPADLDLVLNRIEQRYLEAALKETNGAKKKAAQLLGINFRSFRYRLQKYNLAPGEEGDVV